MLSAHTLLIAAIFVPYVIIMGVLFAWICRSGQPPDSSDDGDDDPEPALP